MSFSTSGVGSAPTATLDVTSRNRNQRNRTTLKFFPVPAAIRGNLTQTPDAEAPPVLRFLAIMNTLTPISRDGHVYSFTEGGLEYKDPFGREKVLSFSSRLRLRKSLWGAALSIRGPAGTIPLAPLNSSERQALVMEFFRRYRRQNPEVAKKSAFDYIEGQRSFAGVALAVSLFFSAPLATVLLADSREQFVCTDVLKRSSALSEMQVVKAKKKRKGHYILDLELTTPQGITIRGRDQLITEDETKIPKAVPVVYSPEQPSCWSLTPGLTGSEPNWAKRRFFGTFTALFGGFFLFSSLTGFFWGLGLLLQKRPFREELKAEFQL